MDPKSSWPDQHREAALKSYIYAQMSNNAYGQAGDECLLRLALTYHLPDKSQDAACSASFDA